MKRRVKKNKRNRKETGRELLKEAIACITFAAAAWMPLIAYLWGVPAF